jgi:capsular exopolysaccharide synthesis family protein
VDGRLRNGRQLRDLLGARDLGLVPVAPLAGRRRRRQPAHLQLLAKPHGAYAESVRSLFGKIQRAHHRPPQVVLLTSSLPGEGKTTLACSLAMAAGQLEKRTLLVDLDLRRPRVAEAFGLCLLDGVVEVAGGRVRLEEAVLAVPGVPVDVLGVAGPRGDPISVLLPHRLEALLSEARSRYDVIIIDTPPALGVADARTIAEHADSIVFVVRWDHTKQEAAAAALRQLDTFEPKLAGAVLNLVNLKRQAQLAYGDEGQYFNEYRRIYRD